LGPYPGKRIHILLIKARCEGYVITATLSGLKSVLFMIPMAYIILKAASLHQWNQHRLRTSKGICLYILQDGRDSGAWSSARQQLLACVLGEERSQIGPMLVWTNYIYECEHERASNAVCDPKTPYRIWKIRRIACILIS